jgi:cytochrome c2
MVNTESTACEIRGARECSRRERTDLALRSRRIAEFLGPRAFATAGLRPAAGRGRDPHRQAAGGEVRRAVLVCLVGLAVVGSVTTSSAPSSVFAAQRAQLTTPWADWVEPDFPFFSSVLDARHAGSAFAADNLTPRALILNLGHGLWAAFDVDLLRVAAIWRGNGVTPKALAPGSYHQPDKKTPGGQTPAPEPDGVVWVANGIYPGWQPTASVSLRDPREAAPSIEEVGRGALPERIGQFKAIRIAANGTVLEYTVAGVDVREWISAASDGTAIVRQFHIEPSTMVLSLVAGLRDARPNVLQIAAHGTPVEFQVRCREDGRCERQDVVAPWPEASLKRWPQEITTRITRSNDSDAFVVDDIALPEDNPWRRAVRISDIQFLKDGTGVGVTLDGDVWLIRGLSDPSNIVRWRRFTSGLHEPLSLAIRDDQIYVFDRNGIWRIRDTEGDGEADVHELFSNAFAQTADMREFPNTIRVAPGGDFIIAKGNQQATTIGKHNGTVLRISADGRRVTQLGYGFRQPNISVDPKSGLVIASDQQGNYVPSTPLHVVRDNQFYGFLSEKQPREVYPAPIADPITWIPHTVNASGTSQVWLDGARMGPLTGSLVQIGFNRPELFRVLVNNRAEKPQAAVVSVTHAFDYPPLHGSVNPIDGQLYIAGFQILGWGTTATRLAGLGRVRYTGAPSTVPSDLVPTDRGVLLRFDVPLDRPKAADVDNYSVTSWHYKRTYQYGSPNFRADETPGIDPVNPSRAYVSSDRRSVFIAIPGMKPVMQMRIAWSIATASGVAFQESAYFTPYDLTPFDPRKEGFGDISVDLTPRAVPPTARSAAPSVEEGRRIAQTYGCAACHAAEDASIAKLGPPWKGLYGRERTFGTGTVRIVADDNYLRESILNPSAKVVTGYEAAMPSFAGVLTDPQIESVILYIKSLR